MYYSFFDGRMSYKSLCNYGILSHTEDNHRSPRKMYVEGAKILKKHSVIDKALVVRKKSGFIKRSCPACS